MPNTEYEYQIICPWCGHDDSDDRYEGEGEYKAWCSSCGKLYSFSVHVFIRYSTTQVEEEAKSDA